MSLSPVCERFRRRLFPVAVMTVLAGCASAPGIGERLTESDLALVAQTTQKALEDNPVGLSSNWANEETGHRGTVTPTRTYTSDSGATCRTFQQTATVDGRTIFAYDRACRDADGQWRTRGGGSLAQAIRKGESDAAYARRYYPGYAYDDPYCRWPYRDPLCRPYYDGYPGASVGFGFGFGF